MNIFELNSIYIIILLIISIALILPFLLSGLFYIYLLITFNYCRNEKNFKGKHIIIFGGSSGLGEALVIRLSKQQVHLSIASRTETKLKETKKKCLLNNINSSCDYYIVDVTNDNQVKRCFDESIKKWGFPSLIINCAGIAHPGFLLDLSLDIYIKDMNLNYFGNLIILKEAIKQYNIKKMQINDTIDVVCVGSCLGIIGSIGYSAYCPTKYALKGLLDSLSFELLDTKIKLHYYGPANLDTPGLVEENKTKPKLVSDMENNAKTISADEGALILLSNLDKYMITSEPDLELLKICPSFMTKNRIIDFFLFPIASIGIFFSRISIEKNILKKIRNKNNY